MKQDDYDFQGFCRYARYIPQMKQYTINCNGKLLRSNDTGDLYNQYKNELDNMRLANPKLNV